MFQTVFDIGVLARCLLCKLMFLNPAINVCNNVLHSDYVCYYVPKQLQLGTVV